MKKDLPYYFIFINTVPGLFITPLNLRFHQLLDNQHNATNVGCFLRFLYLQRTLHYLQAHHLSGIKV